MSTLAADRVALLVVRVWLEADAPSQFRARVSWIDDLASPEQRTEVVTRREELRDLVSQWVDGIGAGVR